MKRSTNGLQPWARYAVECWDPDKGHGGSFSAPLARTFIRKASGLTWRQLGRAIRVLRGYGWDDLSVYVYRCDKRYAREQKANWDRLIEVESKQGI